MNRLNTSHFSARRALAVLLFLLSLTPTRTLAQDVSIERARHHFESGQDFYDKGEYAKAAEEFMAAHATKPFAAFLFNAAVCHEKLMDYSKAVELFRRYLSEDPKARDRAEVEKRVSVLEAEIQRLASMPAPSTQPAGQPTTQPATPSEPGEATLPPSARTERDERPSAALLALPEAKTKGLIVVESKPPGAAIFLDNKKAGPLGVTPWNGSLDGEHEIILESKGYKTERKKIAPSPDKLVWIYVALSEEHFLGWLEVRANIPGADVFLDRVDVGAIGRTPFLGNVQPGKHKIIVSKEGYTPVEKAIEIDRGKAHNVEVKLSPAPVGFVRVRGEDIVGAKVTIDGKQACPRAPCRFQAPEGTHVIGVGKEGKKPFRKELAIEKSTETSVSVKLAPKPSRVGALWNFTLAAGFFAGAYFLAPLAEGLDDDLGFGKPEHYRYATYILLGGIGVLETISGIVYLVEDRGPPSTGRVETRELTIGPSIGPHHAGLGAAFRW
ncbi:MAG: PEGA domain-containing protein [Deltaproteobacteria bacterium]|nr:PEGA domain-containing protein [Deltaproteobacteria bacterium]